MQSIQDRAKHYTDVAKWKVDQETRKLKTQNKISDFKDQLRKNKNLLGDLTYALYQEKKLKVAGLSTMCGEIDVLYQAVEKSKIELETIRNEEPPSFLPKVEEIYSGLECPQCGKKLTGKYCPIHGEEGVRQEAPTPSQESESGLHCPECGRSVPKTFCVKCGVKGVKNEIKNEQVTDKPEGEPESTKTVCPKCGKPLTTKFCNICGSEGVTETIKAEEKENKVKEIDTVEVIDDIENKLVCPKCGKLVEMKYCNECGEEGIPESKPTETKKPIAEEKNMSEGKTSKSELLVCPKCEKTLIHKFCNICGEKGVPAKKETPAETKKSPAPKVVGSKKPNPKSTTSKKSTVKARTTKKAEASKTKKEGTK